MRDSFFGLHIRPTIKQAPSPNRDLGTRLVNLYFDYANPQIPILHRGDFTTPFNRVYLSEEGSRTPRELYMLNIVFAIGAGIILGDSDPTLTSLCVVDLSNQCDPTYPSIKRRRLSTRQHQPEEYHASATVHLVRIVISW